MKNKKNLYAAIFAVCVFGAIYFSWFSDSSPEPELQDTTATRRDRDGHLLEDEEAERRMKIEEENISEETPERRVREENEDDEYQRRQRRDDQTVKKKEIHPPA